MDRSGALKTSGTGSRVLLTELEKKTFAWSYGVGLDIG